jgi:hypothetical protein
MGLPCSTLHARFRRLFEKCQLPLHMEAVIKQYPLFLKAIYLPDNYAAIVLLGIVTSPKEAPITMELSVGFEVHLPYLTKDGN